MYCNLYPIFFFFKEIEWNNGTWAPLCIFICVFWILHILLFKKSHITYQKAPGNNFNVFKNHRIDISFRSVQFLLLFTTPDHSGVKNAKNSEIFWMKPRAKVKIKILLFLFSISNVDFLPLSRGFSTD